MISLLISYFWYQIDYEEQKKNPMELWLFFILSEMVSYGVIGYPGYRIIWDGAKVVYSLVTCWTDWQIKKVYCMINQVFGCIFLIFLVTQGLVSSCWINLVIFSVFVMLCEKCKAFERGDTQYLLVCAIYFLGIRHFPLEWMLWNMLIASFIFGIFRKIGVGKGESMPYTPILYFSEFILHLFRIGLCLI